MIGKKIEAEKIVNELKQIEGAISDIAYPIDIDKEYFERIKYAEENSKRLVSEEKKHKNENKIIKDYRTFPIAWYVSYHFGLKKWGIYVTEEGIDLLSKKYFKDLNNNSEYFAESFLYNHEFFHYVTDRFITSFELLCQKAAYVPLSKLGEKNYYILKEEGLAEAYSLRESLNIFEGNMLREENDFPGKNFQEKIGIRHKMLNLRHKLEELIINAPEGYSDGIEFYDNFSKELNNLHKLFLSLFDFKKFSQGWKGVVIDENLNRGDYDNINFTSLFSDYFDTDKEDIPYYIVDKKMIARKAEYRPVFFVGEDF